MPHRIHIERPILPRAHLLGTAALVSGVLVAGCGGSSPSATGRVSASASSGASAVESGVAFARCIRSHGVPSFPDPKISGHTARLGSAAVLQSPAFQSAAHSCQRLLPKGPPGPEPPSHQAQARMLEVSACMRKHGISGFPDPTTAPPSSSAGYSGIIGNGGYFLAIPSSIDTRSPAFEQAAAACNFGPRR
jgi:hypothetical protein